VDRSEMIKNLVINDVKMIIENNFLTEIGRKFIPLRAQNDVS